MKKLKKAIVLSLVICMSLFMSINVYAEAIPECTTTHTVGQHAWPANYTECGGGYKEDVYVCEICNAAVFKDGSAAKEEVGTGIHKPGTELYEADYVECIGGFKEDHYLCTACGNPTDKDGKDVYMEPGTGVHTPGATEYPADYTSCRGGYNEAHYYCTICNRGVDVNGNHILMYPGDGNHEIVAVPAKDATTQAEGNLAYWQCEICGLAFKDKDGNEYIRDISAYILPKLPQSPQDRGEKDPAISPDTGDETPLAFISCLMLLSLLGLSMTWMRGRKTQHMNE